MAIIQLHRARRYHGNDDGFVVPHRGSPSTVNESYLSLKLIDFSWCGGAPRSLAMHPRIAGARRVAIAFHLSL
ncbi:MAG: hypothetical protein KIT76_14445 [Pseudolabrys sp.]|nr:hypothetical protein [Pseudolabrys sp.]